MANGRGVRGNEGEGRRTRGALQQEILPGLGKIRALCLRLRHMRIIYFAAMNPWIFL